MDSHMEKEMLKKEMRNWMYITYLTPKCPMNLKTDADLLSVLVRLRSSLQMSSLSFL